VRSSVDNHASPAFKDDEEFVHVDVGVGDKDFARGDNNARDLGEWRKFSLAEPNAFFAAGLWLTGSSGMPLMLLSFTIF